MGRKKRKTVVGDTGGNEPSIVPKEETLSTNEPSQPVPPPLLPSIPPPPPPIPPLLSAPPSIRPELSTSQNSNKSNNTKNVESEEQEKEQKSSKYAMTTHSGEVFGEDFYVSDGSEDEDENVDVVLAASRSGMMRRGLVTANSAALVLNPNRQWIRPGTSGGASSGAAVTIDGDNHPYYNYNNPYQSSAAEDAEKQRLEELEKLDPVQRAARLQAEKQRLEQQEKEQERLRESQENAGRDPNLFSKRTAFDIRFDQMEEKPWLRGSGDNISDFFNYGMDEAEWLEYAQQQLAIRQELTDAARAKRQPDPTIVPVIPKKPSSQAPRVAVVGSTATHNKAGRSAAGVGGDISAMTGAGGIMGVAGISDRQQGVGNNNNNNNNNNQDGENDVDEDDEDEMALAVPLGPSLPASGGIPALTAGASTASLPKTLLSDDAAVAAAAAAGIGGAWGALPGSHLAMLIEEQERQLQQQQQEQQQEQQQLQQHGASSNTLNDPLLTGGGVNTKYDSLYSVESNYSPEQPHPQQQQQQQQQPLEGGGFFGGDGGGGGGGHRSDGDGRGDGGRPYDGGSVAVAVAVTEEGGGDIHGGGYQGDFLSGGGGGAGGGGGYYGASDSAGGHYGGDFRGGYGGGGSGGYPAPPPPPPPPSRRGGYGGGRGRGGWGGDGRGGGGGDDFYNRKRPRGEWRR